MDPHNPVTFRDYLIASPKRLFFGLIVVVFSLNGLLSFIAKKNPDSAFSNYVYQVSQFPDYLYNLVPGRKYFLFAIILHWVVISIFVFFTLLAITSFRHGSLSFLISGLGGFVGGLLSLTIITLPFYAIYRLFPLFIWIFNVVYAIGLYLFSWLFWPPFLVVIGAGVVVYLVIKHLDSVPTIILLATGLALAGWLLWYLYGLIYPTLLAIAAFLREYIAPIGAWIAAAVMVVIICAVVISISAAIVWTLGDFFIRQFAESKFCGRSSFEAFDTSFGAGAALSLILLVCASNSTYHEIAKFIWSEAAFVLPQVDPINFAYWLMPSEAFNAYVHVLQWSSIPIFDSTSLLICLFLMNASLLMGLISGTFIVPVLDLVSKDRIPKLGWLLVGALVIPIIVMAVDSTSSSE